MIVGVSILMSAQRFLMYLENRNLFTEFSINNILDVIKKGFIYDISTVLYINIAFIFLFLLPVRRYNSSVYKFLLKTIFLAVNTAAILINIVDIDVYRHLHHRLIIFDTKSNLLQSWNNFLSADWQVFFKDYSSILIYFIAFFIILVLLSGFIKNIDFENKSSIKLMKISSILSVIIISSLFVNSILYNKGSLYKNIYLKADRKLTAVLVNNPYLLIAAYFANEKELILDDSWHLSSYSPVNKYDTNVNKEKFKYIKLIVSQSGINFKTKKHNTQLSGINNNYDNVFQVLDELLFSFPSVFRAGLYKSLYSLNNMKSLVDILQSEGYCTQLKTYGYSDEKTKLIRNFYSLNNYENTDSIKTFELVLIKDNNIADSIVSQYVNNENNKGSSLIINVLRADKKEDVSKWQTTKSINFFTNYKLHLYKDSNVIFTQYMDIKPSILHLIGYSKQFISYGRSLFKSNNKHCKYHIISDSSYCALSDSLLLHFAKGEAVSLYKMRNNKFSGYNFIDSLAVECTAIENKLQSMLYDFRKRMVNNTLWLRSKQ